MQETEEMQVGSLGREDPLEEETATQSSVLLAWRIPWTEEPGGLQYKVSQRARLDWALLTVQERNAGVGVGERVPRGAAPVGRCSAQALHVGLYHLLLSMTTFIFPSGIPINPALGSQSTSLLFPLCPFSSTLINKPTGKKKKKSVDIICQKSAISTPTDWHQEENLYRIWLACTSEALVYFTSV